MVSLSSRESRREQPHSEIETSLSSSWRPISLSSRISLPVSKLKPRNAYWPVKSMSMPPSLALRSKTSLSMSNTWACWKLTMMSNSARWFLTRRRCTQSLVCTWCTYLLIIKSLSITPKLSLFQLRSNKTMFSSEFLSLSISFSSKALTIRSSLKGKMYLTRPISSLWIIS